MADSLWVLPFGKYKGQEIETVPDSYLHWCLEQDWFCEKFPDKLDDLNQELQYRVDFEKQIRD
jgi:uncharacterized protein (DUF3820 family)